MVIGDDPASALCLDETLHAVIVRLLPHKHEHSRHGKVGDFAGLHVLEDEVLDHSVALDFLDYGVVHRLNLRVGECLSYCRSVCPELVPAVNDVHLRCKLGEVSALFYRCVSSADYCDLEVLEECSVAHCAEANALPDVFGLSFTAEPAEMRTGRYDYCLCLDLVRLALFRGDDYFLVAPEFDLARVNHANLRVELQRVILQHFADFRARGMGYAGVVLDFVSDVYLTACRSAFKNENIKTCASSVNGC